MNLGSSDFQIITIVTIITSCIVTIFWMVVGWRAMRAHEKIAAALKSDSRLKTNLIRAQSQEKQEENMFQEFIDANPHVKHLDTTEQLRRYAEWKLKQE